MRCKYCDRPLRYKNGDLVNDDNPAGDGTVYCRRHPIYGWVNHESQENK
jgi:hypothetical protein